VCKDDLYYLCKMSVVFYIVNMYMSIYDLFHILLSLSHTYGSMECMYAYMCACMCVYMYIFF